MLKSRNLHDEVHLVFTAPWQSAVRKEESQSRLDSIYRQRFAADFDEVKRYGHGSTIIPSASI